MTPDTVDNMVVSDVDETGQAQAPKPNPTKVLKYKLVVETKEAWTQYDPPPKPKGKDAKIQVKTADLMKRYSRSRGNFTHKIQSHTSTNA